MTHNNLNGQRRAEGMPLLIAEAPVAGIGSWFGGGSEVYGELRPFAGFDDFVQSRWFASHTFTTDENQLILIHPIARSVVFNFPCLGKGLPWKHDRSGWDCFIAQQAQVVASIRQRGGVGGWGVLRPSRRWGGIRDDRIEDDWRESES